MDWGTWDCDKDRITKRGENLQADTMKVDLKRKGGKEECGTNVKKKIKKRQWGCLRR